MLVECYPALNTSFVHTHHTTPQPTYIHRSRTLRSLSCRTDKEIAADPAKLKRIVRLQAFFRGRLARRRFRRMNKRTEIAREILSTERTYVSSLEVRRSDLIPSSLD